MESICMCLQLVWCRVDDSFTHHYDSYMYSVWGFLFFEKKQT